MNVAKRNTDSFLDFIFFCFMNKKNRVSVKVVVRELGIRLLLNRLFKSNDSAEFKNYTAGIIFCDDI